MGVRGSISCTTRTHRQALWFMSWPSSDQFFCRKAGSSEHTLPSGFQQFLAPHAMADQRAMANAETKKVFADVGAKFNLEDKVTTWLTSPEGLGAHTLDDFLYSCADDKDVRKLAQHAEPVNEQLAVSRLRQAWRSLKRSRDSAEDVKCVGLDTTDMDELLPSSSILDNIEVRHWNRYRVIWALEIAPADTVVSRVVREIGKRTLGLREIFKVRTQAHLQRAVRKRTKLANGFDMLSAEAEEQEVRHTLQNYLCGLNTLMIAYRMSGSRLRADAPESEPKAMDSTRVVECPLDVLTRYVFRVEDRAHRVPYPAAFDWIQRSDELDRAAWVDRFRNSTESLGEVIQHTLATREAMWEVLLALENRSPRGAPGAGTHGLGAAPKRAAAKTAATPGGGGKALNAESLRDGSRLCSNFNMGKRTRNNCAYIR